MVPDKEPGEEPATEKQIAYIKNLTSEIDLPDDFGKWQASSLIDQLKASRSQMADDYIRKQSGGGCFGVIIIAAIFLASLIFNAITV